MTMVSRKTALRADQAKAKFQASQDTFEQSLASPGASQRKNEACGLLYPEFDGIQGNSEIKALNRLGAQIEY